MGLGAVDLSVLFSPAVKLWELSVQPGCLLSPAEGRGISFAAEGMEMLPFGKFQVVPCCLIHFCPLPQKEPGPAPAAAASWG